MKLLKIGLISIFIIILLSQSVLAIGEIFDTASSFKEASKDTITETLDTKLLQEGSGKIYNVLLTVAIGVAVVVGAILAVRFMTAGIDRKVEVKEVLFPYLVSCIVVFGSLGIWRLAVNILSTMETSSSVTSSNSEKTTSTPSKSSSSSSGGIHQSSSGGIHSGSGRDI